MNKNESEKPTVDIRLCDEMYWHLCVVLHVYVQSACVVWCVFHSGFCKSHANVVLRMLADNLFDWNLCMYIIECSCIFERHKYDARRCWFYLKTPQKNCIHSQSSFGVSPFQCCAPISTKYWIKHFFSFFFLLPGSSKFFCSHGTFSVFLMFCCLLLFIFFSFLFLSFMNNFLWLSMRANLLR